MTPESMQQGKRIYPTPYGDVSVGQFKEVLSLPGRYLNDHCLIREGDQWHFFGIVGQIPRADLHDDGSRSEITFAHATSRDLQNWTPHPDVLMISGQWPEVTHIFAPAVFEHNRRFYMLYAAADERAIQRICLATSDDLFTWNRYPGNPVIVPSVSWSRWPGFGLDASDDGSFGGCRDPHIIQLDDGSFVSYWVSRMQEKFGGDLCCVAASISHDLIHWQEIGPVFALRAWHQPLTREVESACVVRNDGRYWLFFKNGWWTHFVVSDSPFDFRGCEPIRLGYSHASKVIEWNGQWWITHCKTDPDDFLQNKSDRSRGLFIGRLQWPDGSYPKVV